MIRHLVFVAGSPMTSRLITVFAACVLLPWHAVADPLLTKAQIAKAADQIAACLRRRSGGYPFCRS
jgi:hypothetical protein